METFKQKNAIRTTSLQAVAAVVVLAGAALSLWQLNVSREGQRTERFTKAIDQIGSDSVEVRVGGLFALEQIAYHSVRDRESISEILCAFIRTRSPLPDAGTESELDTLPILPVRSPDVQTAIRVLSRHPVSLAKGERYVFDVDLRKAVLPGARLDRANLANSRLDGAFLKGGSLTGANLMGTSLEGCNLDWVDLTSARADAKTRWPRNELGEEMFGDETLQALGVEIRNE